MDNLSLWSKIHPESAQLLLKAEKLPPKSELSEKKLLDWRHQLSLTHYSALVVYGFAETAYSLLKPWLDENPQRTAIFLEDDAEKVNKFLSSASAEAFLRDKQAWLYFGNTMEDLQKGITSYALCYPFHNVLFTALPDGDPQIAHSLHAAGRLIWLKCKDNAQEYQDASSGFTRNLYQNIYLLPESRDFTTFLHTFKGVPAVIIGAGPSLAKNRHLLASVKDKALIIAGGTAINALNAGNIQPHLGVGVDPNHQFYNRILSSTAWEVPFIYYYRMYHRALSLVHGDKLFLNFSAGISIADWIHGELGNLNFPVLFKKEFFNVINLATSIAIAMGCSPILFAGIDLAYTDDSSYASGLKGVAGQSTSTQFLSKQPTEEIIIRNDIYGKPIKTLWKWVLESIWYSQLAMENPHIKFINCTEGGLGFPGIPHATLESTLADCCQTSFDVQKRVQSLVDSSPWCSHASPEKITAVLKKFDESLNRCENAIIKSLNDLSVNSEEESDLSLKEQWKNEPAYEHLLKPFDQYLRYKITLPIQRLTALGEDGEKYTLLEERLKNLQRIITNNRKFIAESMQTPRLPALIPLSEPFPLSKTENGTIYTYYSNGVLKSIIPSQNGLLHGEILLYYHNGTLSRRLHYQEGMKEGLEEIWDRNGQILIRGSYHRDKPTGTAWEWHLNGVLARESVYDEKGALLSSKAWSGSGMALENERENMDTYIQNVHSQVIMLKNALNTILDQVLLLKINNPELIEVLKKDLIKTQNLQNKTDLKTDAFSKDTHEPLWQTPTSTLDIGTEIAAITQSVEKCVKTLQEYIQKAR